MENIFICNGLEAILIKQRESNQLTSKDSMPIFNIGEIITHLKNCPMCKTNLKEYIELELFSINSNDPSVNLIKSIIKKFISEV